MSSFVDDFRELVFGRDAGDCSDVFGVVGEVESRADTDFEDSTSNARQCFFSFGGHGAVIEGEIEKSIEYDAFVPSHGLIGSFGFKGELLLYESAAMVVPGNVDFSKKRNERLIVRWLPLPRTTRVGLRVSLSWRKICDARLKQRGANGY